MASDSGGTGILGVIVGGMLAIGAAVLMATGGLGKTNGPSLTIKILGKS